MDSKSQIDAAIEKRREAVAAVDEATIHDAVGVAQALDELRKALEEVEGHLSRREFEPAADAGYGSVAAGFVFLQRTLGGLHERTLDKTRIVQDIAVATGRAYDDVAPVVDAVMTSMRPRQ